jgi:tRNA-modifying protein YgfZ
MLNTYGASLRWFPRAQLNDAPSPAEVTPLFEFSVNSGFKFEILAKLSPIMLLDLSDRAKFRVTGNDRVRFLNGQLTNDILSLQPGLTICACALTAKGKLCADLFVAATEASHYLDADAVLRESLAARLEKYIIADDVVLEDVTEECGLFHLTDAESPPSLEGLDLFQSESNRFAMPGIDLWFPAHQGALVRERLIQAPIDAEALENLRIEQGIPRWGSELSESVLPNEAGLDTRAISYTKGCYLGQEVISRIKSLGHVNRHLRGLRPAGDLVLAGGDKLVGSDEAGKELGLVTSVGQSRSLDRGIALGYVRRGFDAPGSILQVRRNNTLMGTIEVSSLPFNSA